MDQLKIERALFAGCSIGSYILYELWRRIPERIRMLAFCCGKPQADTVQARERRSKTMESIAVSGTNGLFDQMAQDLTGTAFRQREPRLLEFLRTTMSAVLPETAIRIQRCLMMRPDSVATLPTISVPVLALAGGEDKASTPEEMRRILELIPGAEFHILSQAGHYAAFEEPSSVARILGDFLERAAG
jgi:pimeloyl-ACP methyl ester carboxylesterase